MNEDSHAKLAAEMRASAAHWGGALPRADANGIEWAARVEQLGARTQFYAEQEAKLRVAMLRMYQEVDALHAAKAAREAEIATVREEIAAKAMELERGKSHVMGFDACPCDPCFLRGIAARLGGATT